VYLDGALVLTAASLGPGNVTDPPLVTQYNWRYLDICPNAAGTIDDLYLCDGSGPAPHNGPLGDVQIDVLRPNGPGAVTEWTPEGAPAGWSATDDLTPDDDTTRVVATTAGLSDLYALEDVNTGNSILGAQLLVSACRTQAGPAALAPLLRHAGVTTPLPAQALASSYFYRNRECFVTMPNGDPLTDANINALQAGIRRTV
jgi:hypothetical protein